MEKDNRTVVHSVAAKKKTKKEKEKQKKEETETKMAGKKVPAHVRKMQEELARRKEAEEIMKREEEERRTKEEEEERKREEILRQKEEERMKKKEKEKEKIRRRKEAGLPLTRKQKEEAHRREIMRNQILAANAHNLVVNEIDGKKTRPVYSTKKSMSKTNVVQKKEAKSEAVVDQGEFISAEGESNDEEWDVINQGESVSSDDNKKNGVGEEESDGDEWDAKSWDDSTIHLSAEQAFDVEDEDQKGSMSQLTDQKQVQSPVTKKIQSSDCDEKDSVSKTGVQKESSSSGINLRSPICCVMGHVDAGKTKLLDCIRGTNVQEGEAGGITQQIGATYFPAGKIKERTRESKAEHAELNVPGLLVIDTPGHESFTNLRSRGSGLCDVAILVVDIMDGLKPQTIESIDLLKKGNIDFIVALNKVDRLYGWKTCRNAPIKKAMKQQTKDVLNEFNDRLMKIIAQFQKQDLNTELYYKNKKMGETFSIVPTSAVSGEGIPDLLLLLVKWSERTMVEKLTFSNKVQCTVLEVKVVEGHGTTIDVVLINGVLREGDQIVVCGIQEPIVTTIRALLTPHPMKELRVKGTYQRHKEIKASQGIKIAAQGLEHAIAGADMYVVGPDEDIKGFKKLAMNEENSVLSRIEMSGEGVCVQASSFGSAEALVKFLKSQDIPVRYINRGPVHKKDVKQAIVMLEKKKEYATILAFDVEITPEAREYADGAGVKIFTADVIYHLFDQFKAYINEIKEKRKREAADDAVFPCILKILPSHIYNQKAPILVGVKVLKGIVKVGTPIFVPSKNFMDIGRVTSIQLNGKPVDLAKEGQEVTVKIVGSTAEEQRIVYGRHFDYNNKLYSHITRKSIDAFEAVYKDDECVSGIRDLLSKMEMKLRIS